MHEGLTGAQCRSVKEVLHDCNETRRGCHDSSMSFCMGRGGFLPELADEADEGHDSMSLGATHTSMHKNRHTIMTLISSHSNTLLNQFFTSDRRPQIKPPLLTIKFIKVF